MKIAIITDTHFGVRNDSGFFQRYQYEFFRDKFIPYLLENGINEIIHLGDLFDRRKYINFTSLALAKKTLHLLISNGIFIHLLVGNHDTYYKSDGSIVSSKLLFDYYEYDGKMKIYDKPETVILSSVKFLMVPWIFPSKEEETLEIIKMSTADVCCGHFEMVGVPYRGNIISYNGLKPSVFSHFDNVFSGHYHKSSKYYVGSPYQMSWADYGDEKQIVIYDTINGNVEYELLSDSIYKIIVYNGVDTELKDFDLKDKIVKIIVNNKDNPYDYESFIKQIERQFPYKITSKDEYLYLDSIIDDNGVIDKDTLTILLEYVDDIPEMKCGDVLVVKDIITKIYNKAKNK